MNLVQVTRDFPHLILADIDASAQARGWQSSLVSGVDNRLVRAAFGDRMMVATDLNEKTVREHIGGRSNTVVLLHQLELSGLAARAQVTLPTALLVHTVICPGGKLFRRGTRECPKRMDGLCLLHWYTGPCGSSPDPRHAVERLRTHIALRRELERVQHVAVLSHYMRRHLVGEGLRAPHVVDPRFPRPRGHGVASRPSAAGDRPLVLVAGRMAHAKGTHVALDVARLLADRAHFVLIGEGPQRDDLASQVAAEPGLPVTMIPFLDRDELDPWYRAVDVVLVPSLWPEPAGMVVPDAIEVGTPVVATTRGGLPEWQEIYDGMLTLVEPTPQTLATAVKEVLTSPRLVTDQRREPDTRVHLLDLLEKLAERGAHD